MLTNFAGRAPRFNICRAASCESRKTAVRLTAMSSFQYSCEYSTAGMRPIVPAFVDQNVD